MVKKSNYKKKIAKWKPWVFFWCFLLLLVFIDLAKPFGLKYNTWHIFLHSGIIIFNFFILIFSLRLKISCLKYILIASLLWILAESVFLISHIFEEYYYLENNLILMFMILIAIFIYMKAFKEGIK
jgi:hypothetical protein